MKHKAKKLDQRYNGGEHFKYMVDVTRSISLQNPNKYQGSNRMEKLQAFVDMRTWCWETWGASCEMGAYLPLKQEQVWSWDSEHANLRIYLKTDKELAWFQLKWS